MNATQKRIVMWSVVGVLLVAALAIAFAPQPVTVDLITLSRQPMAVTVDEEGETRIHDVFVLSAPVAGRVQRIDARVGDVVEAGTTVLASIEPGDPVLLDPRSEAQAQAGVQAAESARALAEAEVSQAQAELEFAKAEHDRAHELIADGTISQRDFDSIERSYKTRQAALATARAGLQIRNFELDRARAQLLSPVETQSLHGQCVCLPITAPVNGRVLQVPNSSERVVAAGEPLLEIGDPTDLEIVVDFLSADAVKVESGQQVIIERWGGDIPLEGRVRRVEPFGYTKVSALGIEEQRVNVVIDLSSDPADWQRLGHGYQVDVRIVLWDQADVLAVPLTALFRDQEQWSVFVANDGRAEIRQLELGRRNGLVAQVTAGLAAGEQIIAHPSDQVLDGVRIRSRG
ncbi:MAG: HlyD family efflux transporter periplasmic adaptor subunit [Xanthomonadales bacterium]|nr:HlyD family efflux transporter periplasmic adaptor subunit [Xanthomonadales bacterium]